MSSTTIQDEGTARTDLIRTVENDDPGVARSGLLGRVILRVRADVSVANIFDWGVSDV